MTKFSLPEEEGTSEKTFEEEFRFIEETGEKLFQFLESFSVFI